MKVLTAKKRLIALLLTFPLYFASAPLVLASADSVVVAEDGSVTLVIEKDVLAASTTTSTSSKREPVAVKSVSITPAHMPTRVTVQRAKTENKMSVTVTEKPSTPPSAAPTTISIQPQPAPNVISTQTVDRVILQGANNVTVVSITPSSQNQLSIQQETVNASTTLPITIDSTTHALSAPTARGEVKLILPKVVLDSVVREGLINASVITAAPTLSPQLSLSQDRTGDVVYSVAQSGKLFGVIPVPGTITVANSTGKISAPLFARFLVPFLR